MNKIAAQAQAEQQNEIRAAKRAQVVSRIKGGIVFLTIAAAAVTGLCYHKEVQSAIYAKLDTAKPTATVTDTNNAVIAPGLTGMTQAPNKVSASLATAQQNAAIRDTIIDQIAK